MKIFIQTNPKDRIVQQGTVSATGQRDFSDDCDSTKKFDKYVIYDCDMGSDDAWGLAMLLRGEELFQTLAESSPSEDAYRETFKILAITCVHGNTSVSYSSRNAARLLRVADRLDIPIYKGCQGPMIPRRQEKIRPFHGNDGFGDINFEGDGGNKCLLQKEHAVSAMFRLVCKFPKMVDFILVGPLTNFAMCVNLFGRCFLDKVRNVFIMGGNHCAHGNVTKTAEQNFYLDPEGAYTTLETVKDNLYTILPLEPTLEVCMPLKEFRFNYLGRGRNPVVPLLNMVEEAIYISKNYTNWSACDAELVAAYLFPDKVIEACGTIFSTVELSGMHTRGQMVLDHLHSRQHNSRLIYQLNESNLRKIFAWTAYTEDSNIKDLLASK